MDSRRARALGILVLVCLLAGMFVWAGSITPNPAENRYPGNTELLEDYEAHIGDPVQISGPVVHTEPVIIRISNSHESREINVQNFHPSVSVGERIVVFGTVGDDNTLDSDDAVVREPWEAKYMYLVSFVGGLWVLARLVNGWKINTDRWSVKPRDTPRFSWGGGEDA